MKYIYLSLLTLILGACGTDSGHFKIEGHLLNLNQGEFLVYSPDGAMAGIDTIRVQGGRFTYMGECLRQGSVMIMMPNGTEIPVFVEPGGSLSMEGDAHQLKAIRIEGSRDNELMNDFRKATADTHDGRSLSMEIRKAVEKHPDSQIGLYLTRRYLLDPKHPDYATAKGVMETMKREQPDNPSVDMMYAVAKDLLGTSKGAPLPKITITDINGQTLTPADLRKGIVVISCYASWDFESTNQLRRINDVNRRREQKFRIIALSVDATPGRARSAIGYDLDDYTIVCDGQMFESQLLKRLVIAQTMTTIIIRNGVIIERSLTGVPLYDKLQKM